MGTGEIAMGTGRDRRPGPLATLPASVLHPCCRFESVCTQGRKCSAGDVKNSLNHQDQSRSHSVGLVYPWRLCYSKIMMQENRTHGNHILVVEDEQDIQELICYHLSKEGFATYKASDGETALESITRDKPDLVLLDLMLPKLSGLDVLKTVRFTWQKRDLPIIIVSARTDETDVITGLELGADNYLPKPFSPKVLVANVKALLRRASEPSKDPKETGDSVPPAEQIIIHSLLRIDPVRHEASWDGTLIPLTATEFALLQLMASNPGRVFTRNQLISGMRGDDYPVTERAIDVQIASLRRKLGDGGLIIKTVWGIGYSCQDKP